MTGLLRRVWEAYQADVPPSEREPVLPPRGNRNGRHRDETPSGTAAWLAAQDPVWEHAVIFHSDRPYRPVRQGTDCQLFPAGRGGEAEGRLEVLRRERAARIRRDLAAGRKPVPPPSPQLWERDGDEWHRTG